MIESILKIIASALSIWDSKERTKYQDELKMLKTRYYEEVRKDASIRSNSVLDDTLVRIRILCDTVATAIDSKNA